MEQEQRRYPRVTKPLEAIWQGASGGSMCRLADLSWGGCFVQVVASPAVGEPTRVTAQIGDRSVTLTGRVAYTEPSIGFAMQFDPLTPDQVEVMKELLGAPPIR